MKSLSVLFLALLAGCSGEPVNIKGEQISDARTQSAPLMVQPRKLSKGEALYLRHCADCHGWEGRGHGAADEYMDVPTPVLQRSKLLVEASEHQFVDWVLYGPAAKIQMRQKTADQTDSEVTLLIAHIRKLNTIDWDTVGLGQDVYDQLCANCHGLYGLGDGQFAAHMPVSLPDLSAASYQKQHSDAELRNIIAQGKNAMPGVAEVLSAEEIIAVTAFVRLLSPGYESYDRYCASCHGSDGLPMDLLMPLDESQYIEFENISMPAFDERYLKHHTDQQLAPKVLQMLEDNRATMLHFSGDLQASEVGLIYQYLHTLRAEPL